MNKRLLKIFNEAGFHQPEMERLGIEHKFEKFAELIVRECLEQIDLIRDGCEADNEGQQALGADWAGLAVARHFGVE